jgi:hypothetical protein
MRHAQQTGMVQNLAWIAMVCVMGLTFLQLSCVVRDRRLPAQARAAARPVKDRLPPCR